MRFRVVLAFIFVLFATCLLIFYWLVPFRTINFTSPENSNFSVIGGDMQFYPNMRFPDSKISYKISDCPLKKTNDMQYAFDILSNVTVLQFYPVNNNQEISVTCEEKNRIDNGMFIAGEGGPTNITSGNFAVILNGEILLIRSSDCPRPNIALHELFHVLGFKHSTNPENIMYNTTKCDQTIGMDMIQLINDLYSIPSYPDLIFRNVTAVMNGKFLNLNMTILNYGLRDANESNVSIYADKNLIKEITLKPLSVGYGRTVVIENLWVAQKNINEINLVIDSDFNEINKENNKIKLKIKDD